MIILDNNLKSIIYIVLAALIWSTSFALTKVLLDTVPPLTIGAIRFSLAVAFLWGLLKFKKDHSRPPRKYILIMWASGFLGIFVYFTLENFGVQFATASDATLIIASYPLIALSLELLTKRTTINRPKMVGMGMAIIGVCMVVRGGDTVASEYRGLGIFLLLVGGGVWATYNIVVSKSVGLGIKPLTITYYQSQAGAAAFLFASVSESEQWTLYSTSDWVVLIYLALACSVGAFYFYNAGLKHLSTSSAVNILNLVPIFGMGWAVIIAGESLTGTQVFGGLLVITGVFISLSIRESNQVKLHSKLEGNISERIS